MKFGEGTVYLLYTFSNHNLLLGKTRVGTQVRDLEQGLDQGLKQRPQRKAASLISPSGFFNGLAVPLQDHLGRGGTTHSGQARSTSIS